MRQSNFNLKQNTNPSNTKKKMKNNFEKKTNLNNQYIKTV